MLFRSLIRSSASVILLLVPSREVLISFIVLFIIACLLFSPFRSLLNVSSYSPFYFQDLGSSLLSFFCIHFQVNCLFPLPLLCLVGFYLTPSSAAYFSVFSFCLTYCVWALPFADCRFIVPIVFGVCPQWVRLVQWLV